MTTDGQPIRAYRVRVEVFEPGGEALNHCAIHVPVDALASATPDGWAAYVAGFFGAVAGDVAAIIRDHAGEGVVP